MINQREPGPEESVPPDRALPPEFPPPGFVPEIPPESPITDETISKEAIKDFEESPLPAVVRAGFTKARLDDLTALVDEAFSSRTVRSTRPMKVHDLSITWRYLEGGAVAHGLRVNELSGGFGHAQQSQCGLDPGDHVAWLGTGSQEEYEKVEQLRKCKNCWQNISSK